MSYAKKELHVACNYLLRLMKGQTELSNEQINLFKRTFHDVLSKRFVDHWFPGNKKNSARKKESQVLIYDVSFSDTASW